MPASGFPGADWPLIGRDEELQTVARALGRSETVGVVLAGAAGVGKTRLADECLRLADESHFATGRIVATRAAATIPLGAFAPLLPMPDTSDRRSDLLQSAARQIAERADGQPLMLVVDDAHLLDPASATLLHQLTLTGAAFVVATVRTDAASPDAVVALWKDGGCRRIELRNLSRADSERLIGAVLGGPVDGAAQRDLCEASEGNPLYLHELVLAALEAELLQDRDGLWRLVLPLSSSPRLAELVEARLVALSPDERGLLEIVAVGEPLGPALLERVTAMSTIESVERKGLLTIETGGGRRQVRSAHPLHGDVLRERMPAIRAMAISRRLADAALAGPDPTEESVVRVAVWQLDGGGSPRPELMLEAARQALFAHGGALAARLAQAGLDAGAGPETAVIFAEVLGELGRHAEAHSVLTELQDAETSEEVGALMIMQQADELFAGLGRADEATALLRGAEQDVGDGVWRDEMAVQRASYECLLGEPLAALEHVAPFLEHDAGRAFVRAALAAATALTVTGRCDEAAAIADRGFAERVALGPQQVLPDPRVYLAARALGMTEAGRLTDAEQIARVGYDESLAARVTSVVGSFAHVLGRAALATGGLTTAARWFTEGAAAFRELVHVGPLRWCVAGRVLAASMAGDRATATTAVQELDAIAPTTMLVLEPEVERARAWHALVSGDAAGCRSLLLGACERARLAGALALEAGALHDLARVGAPELAADRMSALAEHVEGPLMTARAIHVAGLTCRDAEALDAAAAAFEEIGAFLYAAEAAAAASAEHRRTGSARASERSAVRAAAFVMACEGARTPALALAGAASILTKREREVATLAAGGSSSKAIADQLTVSVRTVDNHLQRAYEKLGVRGRGELTGALESSALAAPGALEE